MIDRINTKVMVGIATYAGHSYCRREFIENTLELQKTTESLGIKCDVYVLWNGPSFPKKTFPSHWIIEKMDDSGLKGIEVLLKKHNMIRQRVLKDYTHLFMLESDNFPPAETIFKFLTTGKKIVSAVYFIKAEEKLKVDIPDTPQMRERYKEYAGQSMFVVKQDRIPSIWILDGDESRLGHIDDVIPSRGLIKILSAGVGSVLIDCEVLEKVEFKIKDGEIRQFTDFLFYHDAYKLGYDTWLDTDVLAGHRHPWDEVSDQKKWFNAKTLEKADGSKHRP